MVKDVPHLVFLHQGTYHFPPVGSPPELWNNKILMFTSDVIEDQIVPQAVLMPPPLLLMPIPREIKAANLAQQLLQFHLDDTLQKLAPIENDVPDDLCEEIKTRHVMYVPAKELASIFLDGKL
jgi:hypothetical protein